MPLFYLVRAADEYRPLQREGRILLSLSSPGGMLALPGMVLFQVFHFMALPVKSCKVDPCQSVFPEKCLGGFGSHVHDVVCAPRARWPRFVVVRREMSQAR